MHHAAAAPICACTALRKASRAVTRVYDEALAESGMTTTQFAILRTLARVEAMPLSRLADALVMDRSSLYRAIAPVERHGWVRIAPGTQGRAKDAMLTAEGRAAMMGAVPRWEAAQAAIVAGFGNDAWPALAGSLQRITAAALRETR